MSFTDLTGQGFIVLESTNAAKLLANWTVPGPVVESQAGSGQYQFTDTSATNKGAKFYRVRLTTTCAGSRN